MRSCAALHNAMADEVAASGEPFRCYLDTPALHERARALGYVDIEDLDRAALVARFLPTGPAKPRPGPAAMWCEWRPGSAAPRLIGLRRLALFAQLFADPVRIADVNIFLQADPIGGLAGHQ